MNSKNNLSTNAQKAILSAKHGNLDALGDIYPASGITKELLEHGYIKLVNTQPIYGSNKLQLILATYHLTSKGWNFNK